MADAGSEDREPAPARSPAGSPQPAPPLEFEEIARVPLPGETAPVQVAFGPTDRVLTWLHSPDGTLERRLFVLRLGEAGSTPVEVPLEAATVTEAELTLEERLRRERSRELGVGIASASWAEDADVLLVPTAETLLVLEGLEAAAVEGRDLPSPRVVLHSPGRPLVDPQLSPDGSRVAFVRSGDVFVVATAGAASPVQLTATAAEGLTNGLAEFVAQEEMGRSHGLWWSRDGLRIAYAEVDERHIPLYRIVHQGSDAVGEGAQEEHRYPFPGARNAVVRLGVVDAGGGPTVWMDTGDPDRYLARVHWLPDGGLVAELESRDQLELEVVRFDPATGTGSRQHLEDSEIWVNLHDDFTPVPSEAGAAGSPPAWLWSSERTGHRHLELRGPDGALIRLLTSGEWDVDQLEAVDPAGTRAWFTATKDGATERHLYDVPLAGGPVRRLTLDPGYHAVVTDHSGRAFVDRRSALDLPPRLELRSLDDGRLLTTLFDGRDPRIDRLGLEPPEPITLTAADGTVLHGLVYRPDGDGPFPTVVSVYGGPHAQRAVNAWGPTVAMRAQGLRRRGLLVLVLDNRGSARRGLAFEAPIRRLMGHVEVDDQLAGVRWAVEEGLADPSRVGIYGWSYGGYMTLMCLARAPEVFRAGVAGAPVTHWDGYDTHYTERYMGTPEENPDGYRASAVMTHLDGLSGALLLVHGLIDENVHFRHTARLINSLVRRGRRHQLLLFPDERHLPRREEDRAFLEREVAAFLERSLA